MITYLPKVIIEPPLITHTIDFTPGKTDEYYGIVSTSDNYTLPENERVFSNSGWTVDDNGLYLSNPSNYNRLLLLSHQASIGSFSKIKYYLYVPGNNFYLGIFAPKTPQTQVHYSYAIVSTPTELRDSCLGTSYLCLVKQPTVNYNLYTHLCFCYDFSQRIFELYQTNLDFSELTLLHSTPLAVRHTGFLIPGMNGKDTNVNNRLRKIVIEKPQ